MDPEELYFGLGELVATMPNLDADLTSETQMWLGRAHVLVKRAVDTVDQVKFTVASESSCLRRTLEDGKSPLRRPPQRQRSPSIIVFLVSHP
jgi:hypothetical protein